MTTDTLTIDASTTISSHHPTPSPPHHPISPQKLAANRANALKSTGPRSPEGKAKSRLNALKHGLCTAIACLPNESRADYEIIKREILHDLDPIYPLHHYIADRIADTLWRLRRVQDAENKLFEKEAQAAPEELGDDLSACDVLAEACRDRQARIRCGDLPPDPDPFIYQYEPIPPEQNEANEEEAAAVVEETAGTTEAAASAADLPTPEIPASTHNSEPNSPAPVQIEPTDPPAQDPPPPDSNGPMTNEPTTTNRPMATDN